MNVTLASLCTHFCPCIFIISCCVLVGTFILVSDTSNCFVTCDGALQKWFFSNSILSAPSFFMILKGVFLCNFCLLGFGWDVFLFLSVYSSYNLLCFLLQFVFSFIISSFRRGLKLQG
jgi:hypothetical protein